jgi:hypothetical protein
MVLPPDNPFGADVAAGTTGFFQARAEGYYLILPPLPRGQHVIHDDYVALDGNAYHTTYELTIK